MIDQTAENETFNDRAAWVEPVLTIIAFAKSRYEAVLFKFNETVSQRGMLSAIEWQAHDLAYHQAIWDEVRSMADFINDMDGKPDADKAAKIVRSLEALKAATIDCFRIPSSTSIFSNAIEGAKMEAKIKMFGDNGTFTAILKTIKKGQN